MPTIIRTASLVALCLALFAPQARAQDGSVPNPLCSAAQSVPGNAPPWLETGSLEPDDPTTRVHFLTFSAPPGTELVADLRGATTGVGTLQDPFMGLFDSACRLLDANDDWYSLDSHLQFTVPDDGSFTIGISSCCDYAFDGSGGLSEGTWELRIDLAPPAIAAIEATVVDARTGEPIRGDEPPFAGVSLYGCTGPGYDCNRFHTRLNANSLGRVRFEAASVGLDLPAGFYRLEALADDYGFAESGPFEVAAGQSYDAGELALDPPALRVTLASDCGALPPQGGLCSYSVNVFNNTSDPLRATLWSPVSAAGLGSAYGGSRFLASAGEASGGVPAVTTHSIRLEGGDETAVEFSYYVPSFVAIGANFCQSVVVGLPPFPLVNTLADRYLFCVSKLERGFRSADRTAARKLDARSRKGATTAAAGRPADW